MLYFRICDYANPFYFRDFLLFISTWTRVLKTSLWNSRRTWIYSVESQFLEEALVYVFISLKKF